MLTIFQWILSKKAKEGTPEPNFQDLFYLIFFFWKKKKNRCTTCTKAKHW